jgi:hypothetical protein
MILLNTLYDLSEICTTNGLRLQHTGWFRFSASIFYKVLYISFKRDRRS